MTGCANLYSTNLQKNKNTSHVASVSFINIGEYLRTHWIEYNSHFVESKSEATPCVSAIVDVQNLVQFTQCSNMVKYLGMVWLSYGAWPE